MYSLITYLDVTVSTHKMKTILFFVLVVGFAVLEGVKFRCDYKYVHSLGWFKYHNIPATWRDARLRCQLEGGMLASPTISSIKSVIVELMCNVDIFTGIHSTFSQGNYYSVDGVPLAAIPHEWSSYEPDNKKNAESCIILHPDGKMSDANCEETRPYICYREHSHTDVNVCGTPDAEYHFDSRTNKCYKFHTKARTFPRAHFACSAEGGHLAIINSDVEAGVIAEVFAKYPADLMIGTFWKDVAFVGFHSLYEGAEWRTIDGQSLQDAGYATFASGQPDNATDGENCGAVYRNALLYDLWCEKVHPFICEKSPDYPPVCDNATVLDFHENTNRTCDDGQS